MQTGKGELWQDSLWRTTGGWDRWGRAGLCECRMELWDLELLVFAESLLHTCHDSAHCSPTPAPNFYPGHFFLLMSFLCWPPHLFIPNPSRPHNLTPHSSPPPHLSALTTQPLHYLTTSPPHPSPPHLLTSHHFTPLQYSRNCPLAGKPSSDLKIKIVQTQVPGTNIPGTNSQGWDPLGFNSDDHTGNRAKPITGCSPLVCSESAPPPKAQHRQGPCHSSFMGTVLTFCWAFISSSLTDVKSRHYESCPPRENLNDHLSLL